MPNQIGHPLVVFLHAPNLQYITVKAAPVNKVKTASKFVQGGGATAVSAGVVPPSLCTRKKTL